MHIYTLDILAIDITPKMIALIDNHTPFALTMSHASKGCSINASSYYKIIVFFCHSINDFAANIG